jgi:adenylate cyclase
VESIYILRPTDQPTKLRFLIDFSKHGDEGTPGELYDAQDLPIMLKGFNAPAVESQLYADEFGLTLSGYAPIVDANGKSVGLIGADVNAAQILKIKKNVLTTVLLVFGIAIIAIGLVSVLVGRSVRHTLAKIIEAASEIAKGKLDTRIGLDRRDEFGVMSQQIDKMAAELQEREFIRETFGRYVSENVAKALLDRRNKLRLGGEERVVSVLFMDLRGYSTISEQMPPTQVVEMLNQYFGVMNEIIAKYDGSVIEFLGDAILAAFGAPNYLPDHSERAVRCAMEMCQALHALNAQWKNSGLARYWKHTEFKQLTARIGIHSGGVIAGNLGSPTRMKYAVIGDTVNVASRLEGLNKVLSSDICISADVYAHLPEELSDQLSDQGEHNLKGREQKVRVYTMTSKCKEQQNEAEPAL